MTLKIVGALAPEGGNIMWGSYNSKSQNNALAKSFASGATEGEGSNMFIRGDTIYSYGYHFPMAKRIPGGFIVNPDTYSATTNTHQSYVRQALWGEIFECPGCDIDRLTDHLRHKAEETYVKLKKARSRFPDYINDLKRIRVEWKRFKVRFKIADRSLSMRLKFEKHNWLTALIVQHRLMGRI